MEAILMKPFPFSRVLTLTLVVIAALVLLVACRPPQISANPTGNTATPGGSGGGGVNDPEVATMNAVGTEISQAATAAAGGGQPQAGETPQPTAAVVQPSNTPGVIQPAATSTPVLLPPTATPIAPVGASCPNPYTVKDGEWIYKIARDCRVEPSAIIALNPGINPNRIVPGQTLNMPPAGATAVPPATPLATACSGTYTVKSGDNLWRISYNCGLTVESLAAANSIPFPYTIYVGDVIRFP
jgi:LysM repeat protein